MAGYWLADSARRRGADRSGDEPAGLGLLLLDAVRSLDIYLVMGSVLMGTVLLLVGNLLADIALVAVDPRVDFSGLSARHNERAGLPPTFPKNYAEAGLPAWLASVARPRSARLASARVAAAPRGSYGSRHLPADLLSLRGHLAIFRALRSDSPESPQLPDCPPMQPGIWSGRPEWSHGLFWTPIRCAW